MEAGPQESVRRSLGERWVKVNNSEQCPFLVFEGDVPKCKVKRQTGGDDHGYLWLLPSEVSKCCNLFKKCPTYRGATRETCLNCGATFLKEDAGSIIFKDREYSTCPECGSSGVNRQMREEVPDEEGIGETEFG